MGATIVQEDDVSPQSILEALLRWCGEKIHKQGWKEDCAKSSVIRVSAFKLEYINIIMYTCLPTPFIYLDKVWGASSSSDAEISRWIWPSCGQIPHDFTGLPGSSLLAIP